MADDIVTRLREYDCKCAPPDGPIKCGPCQAGDEIERLRTENATLRGAVGEEGRANRLQHLYETTRAELDDVLAAIPFIVKGVPRSMHEEVERLRALIAELLPSVEIGAGWQIGFGAGDDADPSLSDAKDILSRIKAGEFGGISCD